MRHHPLRWVILQEHIWICLVSAKPRRTCGIHSPLCLVVLFCWASRSLNLQECRAPGHFQIPTPSLLTQADTARRTREQALARKEEEIPEDKPVKWSPIGLCSLVSLRPTLGWVMKVKLHVIGAEQSETAIMCRSEKATIRSPGALINLRSMLSGKQ